MNNVFSHNTKMKPTNCTTTIYKALLHLYSCYFIIIRLCVYVYMHFSMKKEKSHLNDRHQKCAITQNIRIYLFDSVYKRKYMVTPFHLHFTFHHFKWFYGRVSPYTYWVLEKSSISNESSCTYLKQGKWLWNLHAHLNPDVSFTLTE